MYIKTNIMTKTTPVQSNLNEIKQIGALDGMVVVVIFRDGSIVTATYVEFFTDGTAVIHVID